MEDWRAKALDMLPELSEEMHEAVTLMQAWIEITLAFERAYVAPRNEDLIRRIYSYAHWSFASAQRSDHAGDDPPTCVVVCLYEHIPTRRASREDMPNWFTLDEVIAMKKTFSYHTSEADFEELKSLFVGRKPHT